MKALTKGKGVHNQIWVLGKLWNIKYVTEKLEAEKSVTKLFYLPDDEALKKNTDNRKEELNKRKIIIITKNGC